MLEIVHLKKSYGSLEVYGDFSLTLKEGETLAVMGNSGAGKSTLLHIVAGLLEADGGEIRGLPERVSYVFQDDRLVPHFTVLENLSLVADIARAEAALEEAGLIAFAKQYPSRLSAGMSRRVAILRAFLYDAPLILMDEPFRNLDLALKYRLMDFYAELKAKSPKSALFVTHDIKEAAYLADRTAVIEGGKIVFETDMKDSSAERRLTDYFLKKEPSI